MKPQARTQSSIGKFITHKGESYTPLQRVLVALAGMLFAGFLVSAVIVVLLVLTGALESDPSTALERDLIVAQQRYQTASTEAKAKGMALADFGPAVRAKARIILLQVKSKDLQLNARKSADELIAAGTLDPLALYACAHALETDPARLGQARSLLASAAHHVDASAGSLARTIYSEYADALFTSGQDKNAREYLSKAAAIAPASPGLYVKLGKRQESTGDYFDAGVAYLTALKFDPHNQAAQKAFDALTKAQPDRAQAARAEVK